ncbi:hypothetical protein LCGC14_2807700, partial [marine sediment metagenome]
QVASRMVAAGMTEKEIGYWLGVKPTTISKWKQRYAEFALATNSQSSAKKVAKAHLVANGLRSAMGFDYEEVDQVLEMEDNPDYNEEDEDCKEPKRILAIKKETRKLKHRSPDKDLLMFFLINLDRGEGEWKNTKSIEIEQRKTTTNISITGNIESSDIRKLAGAAFKEADRIDRKTKKVVSTVIEAEVVEEPNNSAANSEFLETLTDVD